VRDDYGKLFFNILDYTGSATRMFADPDFDGEPSFEGEERIDERGVPTETSTNSLRTWKQRRPVPRRRAPFPRTLAS